MYAGVQKSRDNLFSPPHSVSSIVAHEGFSRLTMQNDIALVQLSGPLNITGGGPMINSLLIFFYYCHGYFHNVKHVIH